MRGNVNLIRDDDLPRRNRDGENARRIRLEESRRRCGIQSKDKEALSVRRSPGRGNCLFPSEESSVTGNQHMPVSTDGDMTRNGRGNVADNGHLCRGKDGTRYGNGWCSIDADERMAPGRNDTVNRSVDLVADGNLPGRDRYGQQAIGIRSEECPGGPSVDPHNEGAHAV